MADSSANARLKEDITVSWNPFTYHSHGRPSKIYDYCIDPQREGKTCIWLCRRQGYNFVAWDVAGEDVEYGDTYSFRLLAGEKWWHRFTFYNCVGVRHVQIKFLREQKEGQGFLVTAKDVNHNEEIARIQQVLNGVELKDPLGCVIDAKGRRHAVNDRHCRNQVEDAIDGSMYCAAIRYASDAQMIRKWTWMPEMLDYFWRHGLRQDGFEFLDGSGFLLSYEHLSYESNTDAEDPYGKAVNALELVRGWRMRRVLWTTLTAIVVDICIVAIVTLLSRSGETGLAAGSYAAAIQALLMALITLLGAVSK